MKNNDLKLLVADIDGTLVNEPREMMPITRAVLNDLHNRGILLGIASGRPIGEHLYAQKDGWNLNFDFDLWIGMNGGQLFDVIHGTRQDFHPLEPDTIRTILDMMEPIGANPFIYEGEDMFSLEVDEQMYASMNRHSIQCTKVDREYLCRQATPKILFRLKNASDMPAAEKFAAQHSSPLYTAFKTQPTMLEFQDPRVNKGLGVQQFCREHGIDEEDVICFGDMSNDNGMMSLPGTSVCLCNGSDDTKALADYVTEYDNDHDGLGRWMLDHWYHDHGWIL